jgi:hypothetical protein
MCTSRPGSSMKIRCHTPRGTTIAWSARSSTSRSLVELEPHAHATGDEVEELVGVGVHLARVRRLGDEHRCADGVAVDARRRPALPLHEPGFPCRPLEPHGLPGQVERRAGRYLPLTSHVRCSPWASVRFAPLRGSREPAPGDRARDTRWTSRTRR